MPDSDTPATDNLPVQAPKPKPSILGEIFSQANLTTGLAVFAVVLAAAPYVVPQIQVWQVSHGLMRQPAMLEVASAELTRQHEQEALVKSREAILSRQQSLFGDKEDPILGNPNAKIRIVEFLDYNCGYCRAGSPEVKAFLQRNPDVGIVVKEYPVISTNSRPLAAYALAAAASGKYEELHYALMSAHISSEPELFKVLLSVGLDPQAMKEKAASKEVQLHIDRVLTLGEDINVTGTPTFVIDGTPINGARIDGLQAAVDKARKPA